MKFESITFPPQTDSEAFCVFYGYTFTTTLRNQTRKLIIFHHQTSWLLFDTGTLEGYGSIQGLNEKMELNELEAAALNLVKEINQAHKKAAD